MPVAESYSIPCIYKDTVIKHPSGGLYRVKKVNSKTLTVTDVKGKEFVVKVPTQAAWNSLVPVDSGPELDRFVADEFKSTVFFRPGNVVRWPSSTRPEISRETFVVTKVNADGDCNLSPLGGNLTGEFLRAVPAALLMKADGEVTVTNV